MGFHLFSFINFRNLLVSLSLFHILSILAHLALPLCHDNERSTLLQFKQSLVIDPAASYEILHIRRPPRGTKILTAAYGTASNAMMSPVMLSNLILLAVGSLVLSTLAAPFSSLSILNGLTFEKIISIFLISHLGLSAFPG